MLAVLFCVISVVLLVLAVTVSCNFSFTLSVGGDGFGVISVVLLVLAVTFSCNFSFTLSVGGDGFGVILVVLLVLVVLGLLWVRCFTFCLFMIMLQYCIAFCRCRCCLWVTHGSYFL